MLLHFSSGQHALLSPVTYSYFLLGLLTYPFIVLLLKHLFYILQNLVESLSVKNSVLEKELNVARKSSDDTMEKLKDVEGKCNHLQQNLDKYVFRVCICI